MTREEILAAAKQCVCGDRDQDYGSPERSFEMISKLWTPYLEAKCLQITTGNVDHPSHPVLKIGPEDVAAMMCLFKIARIATGHGKADNWIDLAGYAACGGELEGV
jgi:hypothetical protein